MLLTLSRHQMINDVSYAVLSAEITCKRYLVIQSQSKEQNQALDL